MPKIALHLLGQPHLEVDGASLAVKTRKAIALIAYLAVTGQSHNREALDALLWPESAPKKARAALRTTLSVLKKALNDEWLVAEQETIGLDGEAGVWVDVVEFRHLLAQAAGDDCNSKRDPLSRAADLYQGDFMAGFSLRDSANFDEWQFFQAETLRQDLATALEQLIICLKTSQDYKAAIDHARRWLSLDPLHEPVHCQLMDLYALSGQHSAAQRQYQECVRLLKEELGLPPQDETTALYHRLRLGNEGRPLIADRYTCRRLERDLLGQGSMGQVYRETDTETGQTVAVKILKPEVIAHQPGLVERFNREGKALRQLNHPNIIKLLAAGEDEGQPYLVMEYAAGGALRDLLKREGPLPLERVLQIAIELSDALTQTHYRNIIHRDLKPGNVLLDADGTPRLTDFGVAHLAQAERLTQTGMAIGTLDYLAPEALSGERVDARGDIWSLGVLLFEMLAQQRPFPGHTPTEVLTAILTQPAPNLVTLRPDLPPALITLVSRMLVKDPAGRIASARLVGAELEAIMQGREGAEERGSRGERENIPLYPNNLPSQTTPFVGRERELADLARLLTDPQVRLLTILGPGGMGKTRLALEAAAAQADNYSHGVYFVSLAPLSDPEMVVPAIAEAVNFQLQSEQRSPKQQLLDYFREKQLLIVLDNFEHLLDSGAALVYELLQTAPQVRILVTSREQLRLSGETVFTLAGLQAPDSKTGRGTNSGAVKLFVHSARQLQPDFTPQDSDWPSIGHICRLVGGMPLGIILAAGWIEILTPPEIATEISRSLDFLETDLRDFPERQHSLRAVCEQTWAQLTGPEQDVFRRLPVFRGGFTRQAAQAVTGASLKTLVSLVKKSLLQQTSEGRYDLHEFLYQFSADKLDEDSQTREETHDAHRDYYLTFLQGRAAALSGEHQQTALAEISAEIKNIRVGWNRAVAQSRIDQLDQALPGLYRFYWMRSQFDEGHRAFKGAAEHLQNSSVPAESQRILRRLLARQGAFEVRLSKFDSAKVLLQESLDSARNFNDQADIAFALNRLADLAIWQKEAHQAKSLGQEALAISQAIDDEDEILWALLHLSESAQEMGNYIEADKLAQEGLTLSRQRKAQVYIAYCLDGLGWISHLLRDHISSRQYYEASLAIFRELGNRRGVGLALAGLLFPHWDEGGAGLAEAKALSQKAEAVFREIGDRTGVVINLAIQSLIANDQGHYQEARGYASEAFMLGKELPNPFYKINTPSSLGMAECGLGNFQVAREYLHKALTIKITTETPGHLRAIIHAAYLFAKEDTGTQDLQLANSKVSSRILKQAYALQLLTLVLRNSTILQNEKNIATPLLKELETQLPPDLATAARTRGQTQDLQAALPELREALSNPDWVPPLPLSPPPPLSPAPQQRGNLPAQTTPFIGRERDLADLARLLADPQVRLLTVLGPGGIGKTRLALEVAGTQLERFEHGVYLVRLAPLASTDGIVSATAEALGFKFYEGGAPEQQLLDYLRQKQLLLLMDNFEHLLDGANLLADWLEAAPGLKILATSRTRLNLGGEQRFSLAGLLVEEAKAEAEEKAGETEAVRLFLEQARRIEPGFAINEGNRTDIFQVCRLVDGMPLGILLAASWLELLSPAEIAVEIETNLDFLESEQVDLPLRQRSLRAVFDHSWQLLSQREREVLAQLSVFRGGFSREAAQEVTGASLRDLMALVNRTLLQRVAEERLDIHEILRQYAAEKLAQSSQLEATTCQRHSDYFAAFLKRREAGLKGNEPQVTLAEIRTEIDNARAAWTWAMAHGQVSAIEQALEGLYQFYWINNRLQEGEEAFSQAARLFQSPGLEGQSDSILVRILTRQGAFSMAIGHSEAAEELLQTSLAKARGLEDRRETTFCLELLGHLAMRQGKHSKAKQLRQEGLALSKSLGDKALMAAILLGLGHIPHIQGDYHQAKQYYQDALRLYREVGYQIGLTRALDRLGFMAFLLGEYAEAEQLYQDTLVHFKKIGDQEGIGKALGGLALIALNREDAQLVKAKVLAEKGRAVSREVGRPGLIWFFLTLSARIANRLEAYEQAQQFCREAMAIEERTGSPTPTGLIEPLNNLGEAACGMEDFQTARKHLYEALKVGAENKDNLAPHILRTLRILAVLWVREADFVAGDNIARTATLADSGYPAKFGGKEGALELLALIIHHPATWAHTRNRARRESAELETQLPPDIVAAAKTRGQARDLQETVAELLEALANEEKQ